MKLISFLKSFFRNNSHFFYLLIIFFICELIVNPLGDFPLNDDWSYSKSVLILTTKGNYQPGDWGAMTLFTHLFWGYGFCKLFGFSFFVLRLSTLISSFIGVLTIYHLINTTSKNKFLAYIGSITLLLNPLYFNLSNTYMTDINFTTLILLGCFFAYQFLNTQKVIWLLPYSLVSILVVLTRQYGIILPISLFFVILLRRKSSLISIGMTFGIIILTFSALNLYESYLKNILSKEAAYKFSGNINVFNFKFWDLVKYNFETRYASIFTQLLLYSSPILLVFLPSIINKMQVKVLAISLLISVYFTYNFFSEPSFTIGNVFGNMFLGAETFYEKLKPDTNQITHTHSEQFALFFKIFQFVLITIVVALLQVLIVDGLFLKKAKSITNQWALFLIILFSMYVFMLMITESYFDRYHIPLSALYILGIAWSLKNYSTKLIWAFIPLVIFFYISVFGTKDYMKVNEKKWEAYHYLKTINIDPSKINGGFEINCWNEGKLTWWSDFLTLKNYDYLIGYRQEKGFTPYREFEFQRYFPYKMDKISIFVEDSLNRND